MQIKVGMVSLGCSKNQVDAERMLAALQQDDFVLCGNELDCDVIVVNTCGFIEDAKRESIETILEFTSMKEAGQLRAVVVTGCLAERYREEMAREMPEIDVILGIGRNDEIVSAIRDALEGRKTVAFGEKTGLSLEGDRVLVNEPYYAYLKVAEGCDNRCSYCAIPLIRGGFRSRKMEDVVAEAQRLADRGVTELNVVAQDTTRYGEDLYGRLMLPELLRQLCAIEGLHWIRILYCYPERITDELLEEMARQPKIVKYMDVPVQHASGPVLRAMNRRGDRDSLESLMKKIRMRVPGITLRTTIITGFPGETEEDFEALCGFVKQVEFDRLGCFTYSREEDTPASELEQQVDDELKQRRADLIMQLQMDIAARRGQSLVGQRIEVLCEGCDEEMECFCGRSSMDAPDIDTRVYFTAEEEPQAGDYVQVEITDALDYDLTGRRMPDESAQ